jgi:ubiquinone/menaquinone biosynthesis C-methylase UbiE
LAYLRDAGDHGCAYGGDVVYRTTPHGSLACAAAQAQMEEVLDRMTKRGDVGETGNPWALGDYDRFARATVWGLGPVLVDACRIVPGQHVLDVATGTGNVALRAAQAGGVVTATDLTSAGFDAGQREARSLGVELKWMEADACALPFADSSFDVVTSCLGAMFAPDQHAVGAELVRVCRPGGTIAMINFTPEGLAGRFFATVARHAPPSPPGPSPLMWGSEPHVRELFGETLGELELSRDTYSEHSSSPEEYVALFRETFGPIVALRAALAQDPARLRAFDDDFDEFARRSNVGGPGRAEYVYEYLLVVGRTKSA